MKLLLDGWLFMFYSIVKLFCILLIFCSCTVQFSEKEIQAIKYRDDQFGFAQYIIGLSFFGDCEYYKSNPLVIDPDFTKEEREQIIEGIRLWEDALGIDLGEIKIAEKNCSIGNVVSNCIVKEQNYSITYYNTEANDFVLVDNFPQIIIYMKAFDDNKYNTNHLKDLVAHEVGHYLGLSHTWQGTMSINRKLTPNPIISDFDLTAYSETCIEK